LSYVRDQTATRMNPVVLDTAVKSTLGYYAGTLDPAEQTVPRPRLNVKQFVPIIGPQMFVELLDLAKELGAAPQRLCAGLGCSVEELRRGERISARQAWRIIRRALRLSGRADLGLELGFRENFSHFGLPGLAMRAARTFIEAAEIGIRYQKQISGVCRSWHEHDDEHLTVVVASSLRDQTILPFIVEEYFGSAVAIGRLLVGDEFCLHSLEVAYPEPAYAERYRQLFGCPVYFGRERSCAKVARRWLSMPVATHCPELAAQLGELLEQQAQAKVVPRPCNAVEQLLFRSGNGKLTISQVADALQLSVRTLRRRLNEDGTSFRALIERTRVQAAQKLLRERGMTIAAAAERLGFSDARAFRRAFKRWLGQVPSKMRRPEIPDPVTRGSD
jgi:AraC-like DNA-binding protein